MLVSNKMGTYWSPFLYADSEERSSEATGRLVHGQSHTGHYERLPLRPSLWHLGLELPVLSTVRKEISSTKLPSLFLFVFKSEQTVSDS